MSGVDEHPCKNCANASLADIKCVIFDDGDDRKLQVVVCGHNEIAVKRCEDFNLPYDLEERGFTLNDVDEDGKIFKDGQEVLRNWW